MRCPSAEAGPLRRSYADVDLFGTRRDSKRIDALMVELEDEPDRQFNVLHGNHRLFYWNSSNNGRQIDVFLDVFDMCHRIDLASRVQYAARRCRSPTSCSASSKWSRRTRRTSRTFSLLLDHQLTDD